jgi:hypothetical protein
MKIYMVLLGVFSNCAFVQAQDNNIYGQIGIGGNFTTPHHVPFWLRSNQFGSIPLPGNSGSVYGSFHKYYDTLNRPLVDWGGSLEGRVNLGSTAQGMITEGYLKLAVSEFELKAGRVKEIMGLMDSTLSSGSFAMSGNALGIPKVEVSMPQYFAIPILGEVFAFKGNFAYGWLGSVPIQYRYKGRLNTLFHQKSFYARFGKPEWRLHLYGGFNHQVMFGGEKTVFGKTYDLNGWQTLMHVVSGKTWNYSKVGNHLGSIDLALQYDFNEFSIYIYRQNFYDEGALYYLANIADGLNGIRITHTGQSNARITWKKILLEFFYSKDQAGYPWSKPTKSGDENYYNNYEYAEGWSYKQAGIGSPLISDRLDTRIFQNDPHDFFNNNRVVAVHAGIEAAIRDFEITGKITYSKNYGTFATSPYGHSTGVIRNKPVGFFPTVQELSTYVEVNKQYRENLQLSLIAAFDYGHLLYNSYGLSFRISKSF